LKGVEDAVLDRDEWHVIPFSASRGVEKLEELRNQLVKTYPNFNVHLVIPSVSFTVYWKPALNEVEQLVLQSLTEEANIILRKNPRNQVWNQIQSGFKITGITDEKEAEEKLKKLIDEAVLSNKVAFIDQAERK
jgi:hypothetical protein